MNPFICCPESTDVMYTFDILTVSTINVYSEQAEVVHVNKKTKVKYEQSQSQVQKVIQSADQTFKKQNYFKVKPCMCEMKQEQARGQCSYQQTVAIIQALEGHMCCTVGLDMQRGPQGPTGAHMWCLESKRPPCQKPISWNAGGL